MHLIRFDPLKHLILMRLYVEAEVFDQRVCSECFQKVLLGELGKRRVTLTALTRLLCTHIPPVYQSLLSSRACSNHNSITLIDLAALVALVAIEEKLKGFQNQSSVLFELESLLFIIRAAFLHFLFVELQTGLFERVCPLFARRLFVRQLAKHLLLMTSMSSEHRLHSKITVGFARFAPIAIVDGVCDLILV